MADTEILVKRERVCTLQIIEHLNEIFRRRLFSVKGFKSLHDYAVNHLGYSTSQAQRRINACRLIKDMPELKNDIKSGNLTLSNASSLFGHIIEEQKNLNKRFSKEEKQKLADKIKGKSARSAQQILANNSTREDKPYEQKRIIKNNRVQVTFSLSEEEYQDLMDLKNAMKSTSIEETVLKMTRIAKRQQGEKIKTAPRKQRIIKPTSRTIPKKVKETAFIKSNGRCQICGSTSNLEYDHIKAFRHGGTSDVNNIRLICKYCNQRNAIEQFGQKQMDFYINHQRRG